MMNLYRNGFIVATMNVENLIYNAWPLADLDDDEVAEALTNLADNNWFIKYKMQHLAPDFGYIRMYLNHCNKINLDVKVLLFESPDNTIIIDDELEICEVLGYDCIATVYYSYLQDEYDACRAEMLEKGFSLNQHGLLDSLEGALYFNKLRKEVIASGVNLEDFWEELPVRISIVSIAE